MMSVDALSKGIETALIGNYEEAIKILPSGRDAVTLSYKYLCVSSLIKVALSRYQDALIDVNNAAKQSFGNTAHCACKVMALCGLKNFKDAKASLEEWRIKVPDDPLARGEIGALVGEGKSSKSSAPKLNWDTMVTEGLPPDLKNQIECLFINFKALDSDSDQLYNDEIKPGDRVESNKVKSEGNIKYKSRKFEEALSLYNSALSLDPTNVDVYNNISAVYYEMKNYDECVSECEKAVEIARRLMAEYKTIARSYARMGKAYMNMKRYKEAIDSFNKSLTENRTLEVVDLLKQAKKLLEEEEKLAYLDPELSEVHRTSGNDCFKKGLYREAISHYNEALKRNFNDPRIYSNRAACYIKLMAFREAEKDCDAALELDPNFTRALIRKAQTLHAKQEYIKAYEILNKVVEEDKEGVHSAEIAPLLASIRKAFDEAQKSGRDSEAMKKALNNPEVQRIVSDPVMQTVLKQISEDQSAFEEHMKDPQIAKNIRTLIAAGIIQLNH